MHVYEVLRRPVVTEKTLRQRDLTNQYAFEVDRRANRHQIKEAVETVFPNVTVLDVRVVMMPAKHRRAARRQVVRQAIWKKAYVTLAPGQTIQVFEGV